MAAMANPALVTELAKVVAIGIGAASLAQRVGTALREDWENLSRRRLEESRPTERRSTEIPAAATTEDDGSIQTEATTASRSAVQASSMRAMPPPDDGENDEGDSNVPNALKKRIRKELEEIFRSDIGKTVYERLKGRAAADHRNGAARTIKVNKDFRIDVGHRDTEMGVRHWEFQVNGGAKRAAKQVMKKAGAQQGKEKNTHVKLFRDKFDYKNPPEFEAWVEAVLKKCVE